MNVISLAVYKEAKCNREHQMRVKREEVMFQTEMAEKAMSYMNQYELEDLFSNIYDRHNKDQAKNMIVKLVAKGRVLSLLEENVHENGLQYTM